MKYLQQLSLILLFSMPLNANGTRLLSFNLGPMLQYTKYEQGCLPKQIGFMAGPAFEFRIKKPWRPTGHIAFKGLWNLEYICSENGLIINSNEYEGNVHLGFEFQPEGRNFSFIPFTGVDLIHLVHEVKDDIIKSRYFQVNIPIGLEFIQYFSETFTWGAKAYYDIDAWTRLKISTPCLCETDDYEIKLKQSHRFQLSAFFECHYRVNSRVGIDLSWAPLFTWQKLGSDEACNTACDTSCEITTPLNIPELKQWHLGWITTFGLSF